MKTEQKFLEQKQLIREQRRAASLARVSTAEQATKTSLADQLSENRAYADRAGMTIPESFELQDDVSGTVAVKDRPNAGRVYELIERGEIQVVIISTFDRTTRDERVLEYLLFKSFLHEHHVELHYADTGLDPYTMESNLVGYIKSYGSAEERKKIIIRTSKGRRDRALAGLAPCGVPLGYTVLRDPAGKSVGCEFDESFRFLFSELARHFLARESYVGIALALGPHPVTGRGWTWGSVRQMIHNPFYRGLISYGYKAREVPHFTVRGIHTPAWDKETCRQIEAEIERRRDRGQMTPKSRIPGLLDGLLFCGYCGRPMKIRTSNQVKDRRVRSYGCGTWYNRPGYGGRTRPHVSDFIVEHKAVELVNKLLSGLTPEKIKAWLSEHARPVVDDGRVRWLTEQKQSICTQADELEAELESVRTPTARSALQAELRRLAAQTLELERQIMSERSSVEVIPDTYVDELMVFIASGNWKEQPSAEIRRAMRYLKFYIREGELVLPPNHVHV